MTTDLSGINVETVALMLFLDDFQAPRFGSRYQVTLDGERYPVMEDVLNALNQTGPIGKLVTVEILPGYHDLLDDGRLALRIDDPTTGAGDGFAIDFVQLLVNPGTFPSTGTIRGRVTHAETGAPVPGVLVSSPLDAVETGANGQYVLPDAPAGLVVVRAAKPGFSSATEPVDLEAGTDVTVHLKLTPQDETSQIEENLSSEGRVRLRNILFDTGSAKIQAESTPTLQAVRRVMEKRREARFIIEGHTDSEGSAESNRTLSHERAAAVKRWLTEHGIESDRLETTGYGETRPLASNGTAAGRRLNRRVEIAVGE
jgi:outer membrane protein OmpA-like peptidoglycan-associated protein